MKRYEFSYVDDNKDMHFVVVFAENITVAAERVLCRPVKPDEFLFSGRVWFISGWVDTRFSIVETDYQPSSHVVYNPQTKVNPILEGLI